MAGKKKPGETHESLVERQIREAAEEGAFANLRGAGRPLPPLHPEVEGWWIKQKMKAEQLVPRQTVESLRKDAELARTGTAPPSDPHGSIR
jgi:hypothetical protein